VNPNPQFAINRAATVRVRSVLVLLALVGLISCQEQCPGAGAARREEPAAVTTQALPGLPVGKWASFNAESRTSYSGVELGDGSVLACSGSKTGAPSSLTCNRLRFDGTTLSSQSFPLPEVRTSATLTLVPPDRVLFAGGVDVNAELVAARLSSPIGSWTDGGSIWGALEGPVRKDHTASRLDSNVVLIGGLVGTKVVTRIDVRSDQGSWTSVEPTSDLAGRNAHTATVLSGSPARVLVLGGYGSDGKHLKSGFIFSLSNGIVPITDMPDTRAGHTATLLDDGSVLVAGGHSEVDGYPATAWRYHPESDTWADAGSIAPRRLHAAVRLGADVIIAGGLSSNGYPFPGGDEAGADQNPDIVQRYDSATGRWLRAPKLHQGRTGFQLFTLDATHLLALGGSGASSNSQPVGAEVFTAGALGDAADDAISCVSGHFSAVDKVCCDTDCEGACHWCNDPSQPGKCQVVSGDALNQNNCPGNLLCLSQGLCADHCAVNVPCVAGFFCNGGQCEVTRGFGSMCNAKNECSGDSPCVEHVCTQTCDANNPCTEGFFCADAVCHPTRGFGGACNAKIECSGDAPCVEHVCTQTCDANNPCTEGFFCADAVCHSTRGFAGTCSANGECSGDAPCVDHVCSKTCAASDPCGAGFFCAEALCHPTKSIGLECGADSECSNGALCVDGVCCQSACSGSCEACNLPNHLGRCLPRPEGVSCGSSQCTSAGFQPEGTCDGTGTCMTAVMSCGPYRCDDNGCLGACTDDQQCVGEGIHCRAGKCEGCDETACNDNGYTCDTHIGECKTSCEKSERDCAGGYYCHPLEHRCVLAVAFPAASLPACGIGRQPVRSRLPLLALASVLGVVAARRKRRASALHASRRIVSKTGAS
jgi:hypothetical protein